MTESPCWLTVVTVVKDDPTGLTRTLESLRIQSCPRVEILVIDSSADIDNAPSIVSDSGVSHAHDVTVIHEQPSGIYAAMNTGLDRARCEYLLYLNAGDTLDTATSLADVKAVIDAEQPDWVVGRIRVEALDRPPVTSSSWNFDEEKEHCFAPRRVPPHQATVARRDLMTRAGGFDTSYQIAADYALALRMSTMADATMTDVVIARFFEGGASTRHWRRSFREFHRARREILRPTGLRRLRELWDTASHYARVEAYRSVASRRRRSAP